MDLKKLQKNVPFKFRLWNWIWEATQKGNRKIYEKYFVLGYIDARDCMELLDEVVGIGNWQRDHKEIDWKLYCGVWIFNDKDWVWKWDCWTESNTEKEKGESSDAFKRACVNWGIGRFLYTLPNLVITKTEADNNKYNITKFIFEKFKDKLKEYKPANEGTETPKVKTKFTTERLEKMKEWAKDKKKEEIIKQLETIKKDCEVSEIMAKELDLFVKNLK